MVSNQDDLLRLISTASFQTSECAFKNTLELKKILGFTTNAKVARLAIGRSLGEVSMPSFNVDTKGNVIKGKNLFPIEEAPLWIGLIVTHASEYEGITGFDLKKIQSLVKGHWHRGIGLLLADYEQSGGNYNNFIDILITRRAKLPLYTKISGAQQINSTYSELESQINPGAISIDIGKNNSGDVVKWSVNGVGYSPHIAIMGQAGAGKTRVLLNILKQIKIKSNPSIILVDLGKGDLAFNAPLSSELAAKVLRVPEDPIPLDIFYMDNIDTVQISERVMCFRDSLAKVSSSKFGANQKENIRESLKPLFAQKKQISLDDVRGAINTFYEEHNLKIDSVISTINDLTERKLFVPQMSPQDFFTKNWIITFGQALDTYKSLAIYLMLDALNYYLKSLPEAAIGMLGHRAIHTVLAIDEARNLLASRHNALSECIRLHRSKGLVVMLASQSPDDYEGAGDDYLENIGLPLCLKTNAKSPQVLQNMFKTKPNFSQLKTGECLTLLDNRPTRVQLF